MPVIRPMPNCVQLGLLEYLYYVCFVAENGWYGGGTPVQNRNTRKKSLFKRAFDETIRVWKKIPWAQPVSI